MKKLWIGFIVVATLGSIYPFNFQASELDVATIGEFLKTCCVMSGRGDILGNVILFVPIGFTGMFATRLESSVRRRFLFICLTGTVVAFVLQVMQIFLPSRDANLQDVVWNLLGIVSGAVFAGFVVRFSSPSDGRKIEASLAPITLVGTWLIFRLIPFVPSFDLQLIKDSLKPIMGLEVVWVSIIHDATAWIIVGYLLQHVQRGVRMDKYLPVLMIAVFCLEVVIVDNSVTFSNIMGAISAIVIWRSVLCNIRRQEVALVILLFVTLLVSGLAPFEIRWDPVPFSWIPFHGFLGGSMYINTQSAAEKVFLYGSLVYLMWRANVNVFGSVIVGLSFVAIVEFAQTHFAGHTPEITDPLLVIFAALTLVVLERHKIGAVLVSQLDTSSTAARSGNVTENRLRPSKSNGQWSSFSVNLREHQFEFLVRLSGKMGVSVSRVIRRVITQFVDELDRNAAVESHFGTEKIEPNQWRENWVKQSVNLNEDHIEFLVSLSQEMGISVSGVTRRIIGQFLDGLEDHT